MTFFYIKILGTMVVLFSGSGLGYLYGQDMVKRHKELRGLKHIFSVIYGDISYGGMSLGEIFTHVKSQVSKEQLHWIEYLEQETKGRGNKSFAKLWEESVIVGWSDSHLTRADKEELLQAGRTLGSVDKNQQLALLSLYMDTLDSAIAQVGEEKDKRRKMCNVLGVVGSLFVVVFLV